MKTLYKSLIGAAILSAAGFASAGQVYLDAGTNFAADTTPASKVCPTCTSLKDQLTIKYESSTDFFDSDGSLNLSTGDAIKTSGGLAIAGFDATGLSTNIVTSLNPGESFGGGSADNGYGTDWALSFGFTDLEGTVVGFDGSLPLLGYTSGTIELYLTFDGSNFINFMDLIVEGSQNAGPNITLTGVADFTNVDATFNNLFHNEEGKDCAGGADGFFDIWSSAACQAEDLTIDFILDQNTDPNAIVVNPAAPGDYPLIANVTTNHDGSIAFNVPEPGTLALMGLSLVMLGGVSRKKKA